MGPDLTGALQVAASNLEQAKAWDGDEGHYWADNAEAFDDSLRRYQPTFMAAAEIGPGDRVLDVGCGNGACTIEAARLATDGSVLGVDLSGAMLAITRRRAEAAVLGNVELLQADAQSHPFAPGAFDVVLGRTSVMFFGDLAGGLTNLARALRPGGRLVLLVWQRPEANEWIRHIVGAYAAGREMGPPPVGGQGPFALADPEQVRPVLADAGFADVGFRDLREPMYFGPTAESAFDFMHGLNAWMLQGLDEATRARARDALAATMREHEGPDGVEFGSAMWLVTATRA